MDQETKKTPVLLSTAVMVYIDEESSNLSEEAQANLTALERRLVDAVEAAFPESSAEPTGCVAVHFGDQGDIHFYRCAVCGRWLADPADPQTPDGLMTGDWHEGTIYCLEDWLVASGEWPGPL